MTRSPACNMSLRSEGLPICEIIRSYVLNVNCKTAKKLLRFLTTNAHESVLSSLVSIGVNSWLSIRLRRSNYARREIRLRSLIKRTSVRYASNYLQREGVLRCQRNIRARLHQDQASRSN